MPLDGFADDSTPKKLAWVRLPNEVVRDKRLSEAGLILLAYRATFTDPFALNATALLRKPIVRGEGLGRNAIERGVAQMRGASYLKRWQPRTRRKTFNRAAESLTLPPCGASGNAGRMVYRKWFDGTLSVQEMAAYLYLRAGTGRGPCMAARELADRFGWSRPTAAKVIRALIAIGLLAKRESRDRIGRVRGIVYEPLRPVLWHTEPLSKSRGTVHRGTENRGTYIDNPLHEDPSDQPSSRTYNGSYTSPASPAEAPPSFGAGQEGDLYWQAFLEGTLLGWITDDQLAEEMGEVEPAALDAVTAVAADDQLRGFMLSATDKRVANKILGPAGLYAVRWLAATLVDEENEDAPSPAEALVAVLNAIWSRVGSRRGDVPQVRLNSLRLIGKRMAGENYGGGRSTTFYLKDGEPKFRVTTPAPAPAVKPPRQPAPSAQRSAPSDPNLKTLVDADGAKTLAPKLLRDAGGLRAFLQKHGGTDALEIMANVLRRHMIDGKPVSSVRSWRFFDAAIAEELHRRKVSALGVRPGDVFGAHKWGWGRTGTDA